SGRGVYSFCMCPGGYVVNASSENGRLCINGMSYSGRNGSHANSAMIVSVSGRDFGSDHPLAGVEFQRKIEEKAFSVGNGRIPVEHYGDFKQNVLLTDEYTVDADRFFKDEPQCKGDYVFSEVHDILPDELNRAFIDGMEYFDRNYPGFADQNVLVSGIESRTSSPVRILRNDKFTCDAFPGVYPAGEGAGYAGGIMSAAMDGMKVAEAVAGLYRPFGD
ncbi:MAG: FAD-dependent oxidoreductase, partial [Lachnospiraceae bacterium]|nr:FAD-dependent oxidoreductase [Lachnospiraceae bacterium]